VAPYLALALTFISSIVGAAWYLRGQIADLKESVLRAANETQEATAATNQNVAILRTEHMALEKRVGRIEDKVNQ
jgi:hypothetical protein